MPRRRVPRAGADAERPPSMRGRPGRAPASAPPTLGGGRRLRVLLIAEQLRAGADALAERRALLTGDALLALGLAGRRRVLGLPCRELGHRSHAEAERRALLPRDVLAALIGAVL